MKTILHLPNKLARRFKRQQRKIVIGIQQGIHTSCEPKAVWKLISFNKSRFNPIAFKYCTHYAFTIDLRKLQHMKFYSLAGSNAPPFETDIRTGKININSIRLNQ